MKIKKNLSLLLLTTLVAFAFTGVSQAQSQQPSKSYKSKPAQSAKMKKREFQRAYEKELNRKFPLSAISITEDCQAATTCPNGTTLTCAVAGPETSCSSSGSGVSCFKSNSDGSVSGSSGTC